jgi:hypothetical protein
VSQAGGRHFPGSATLTDMPPLLFAIGHSIHTPGFLLQLLQQHSINALCDVRSNPYSKQSPQFVEACGLQETRIACEPEDPTPQSAAR